MRSHFDLHCCPAGVTEVTEVTHDKENVQFEVSHQVECSSNLKTHFLKTAILHLTLWRSSNSGQLKRPTPFGTDARRVLGQWRIDRSAKADARAHPKTYGHLLRSIGSFSSL